MHKYNIEVANFNMITNKKKEWILDGGIYLVFEILDQFIYV